MTSLHEHCTRALPTSVRIELFCRVIAALESMGRRRQRPRRLDPASIVIDGDVVGFGAVDKVVDKAADQKSVGVGGVVVDRAGLLAVAEVVFALEPGRLVRETSPGAPWVVEHIVARLRAGQVLPLPLLHKALQGARARLIDVDDSGLEDLRRTAAVELLQHATRLATAIGPAAPVLFALDEACRVDPDFGDAVERRRRVADALGVDADTLRAEVLRDMHAVLEQRDLDAVARVAAVLHGPGADRRPVLEPLGAFLTFAPVEARRVSAAAKAALVMGIATLVVVVVVGFVVGSRAAVTPVQPSPPAQPIGPIGPIGVDAAPAPPEPPNSAPDSRAGVSVPVPGPAIVNVWLESCGDCMPTFRAWAGLVATGAIDRRHLYNYAYGDERSSTRAFAAEWLVDDNLRFNPTGAIVVHRNGIGTFTTLVTDANGAVVWKGRAVDAGFAGALSAAWKSVDPRARLASTAAPAPLDALQPRATAPAQVTDVEDGLRTAQQAVFSGEFQEALALLRGVERLAPDDPRVHRSLGITYARLRDNQKAAAHYRRYLQLAPDAPDADKVRQIIGSR